VAEARQALARGAAAAVVSNYSSILNVAVFGPQEPVLIVQDLYQALRDLARAARFRTHAQIICAPGSEYRASLGSALAAHGPVYCSGRLVSYSLASLPPTSAYAVFGCVAGIQPDICVITQARSAQSAVLDDMRSGGILIVCADDPYHLEAVVRARAVGVDQIVTLPSADPQHVIPAVLRLATGKIDAGDGVHVFRPRALAFRVGSMVEMGGQRTAMLRGQAQGPILSSLNVQAPFAFMCSGGGKVVNPKRRSGWNEICPNVMGPGDVVVFRQDYEAGSDFLAALRRA
jgi:hypothetical protein